MLTKTKKLRTIKDTRIHDTDTGSPEVQISLLTKRIEELTGHLRKHTGDKHSRRGLLQMVAGRQAHMNYLQKKNPKRYATLAKKLNLKKK
jgi:small subunit ribosomal protein S15